MQTEKTDEMQMTEILASKIRPGRLRRQKTKYNKKIFMVLSLLNSVCQIQEIFSQIIVLLFG